MRNYILFLSAVILSGCGPVSYLTDIAIEQGRCILHPPVTCKAPKYDISFDINDIDLKERYELAAKETGCFLQTKSKVMLKAELHKNQLLTARLYSGKSLIDVKAYQCNSLNLQDKIKENIQDVLTKLKISGTDYEKSN